MCCSICGFEIDEAGGFSSGPGPHRFHSGCINGAYNFIALVAESGGDAEIKRMAIWPNAEKVGVCYPFPPFKSKAEGSK